MSNNLNQRIGELFAELLIRGGKGAEDHLKWLSNPNLNLPSDIAESMFNVLEKHMKE